MKALLGFGIGMGMIGVVSNMIAGNEMAAAWAFTSTLLLIGHLLREYRN
jgi:hypothetical protein